jgi:hypothetical protein
MIANYELFIAHLRRTGRLKLLPQVLAELKRDAARSKKFAPRTETAAENPSLIAGWRRLENGMLTDRTAKSALVDIYKKIAA